MFNLLSIRKPADYEGLYTYLQPDEFGLQDVVDWLINYMNANVGGILIEAPYIDKDYRSTYYHYYAKKGGNYSAQCARLHFFKSGWQLHDSPLSLRRPDGELAHLEKDKGIEDGYLGFMVLRPTRILTIGRSVLSPLALDGVSGRLIVHGHKVHVLGYRVCVTGFPYMQQHSDIAVCAHTACWAILRHYSERYSLYKEVLVHDISKLGREFDPGGLLPSLGISARDAERIFAAVGTYPLLSVRGEAESDRPRFQDELLAYLESGFPLFGVQRDRGHAVAIVGYRTQCDPQLVGDDYKRRAWDFVSHLLVIDDNYQPYLAIPRKANSNEPYTIDDFDGFIAPLPEKMFLPAAAVFELSDQIVGAPPEEFSELESNPEIVMRCFVTTTASWQRFVRANAADFPPDFTSAALELTMPQFIWVVEYATPEQKKQKHIQARLLLDATAGTYEPFPAFLMHDDKGALWIDRVNRLPMQYQAFSEKTPPLVEIDSNLVEY